jgi:hypothetical protein
MSISNPGWVHCLDVLRHAPQDSFDHRLGDELAATDADGALARLIEIVTEDPRGHEYEVAARMLHHLMTPEVVS